MATIGELRIEFVGFEALRASVESIAACISAQLAQRLCDAGFRGIVLGDDTSDLILVEPVGRAAVGAFVLEPLKVSPSDRYLEFVAAIAAHGDAEISRYEHGWPILSSVGRSTTMAEGAAESIRSPKSEA